MTIDRIVLYFEGRRADTIHMAQSNTTESKRQQPKRRVNFEGMGRDEDPDAYDRLRDNGYFEADRYNRWSLSK